MSKQIKISDGLVISREWLEGEIERWKKCKDPWDRVKHEAYLHILKHIQQNASSLSPVIEKTWDKSEKECSDFYFNHKLPAAHLGRVKQEFLTGKIEINE